MQSEMYSRYFSFRNALHFSFYTHVHFTHAHYKHSPVPSFMLCLSGTLDKNTSSQRVKNFSFFLIFFFFSDSESIHVAAGSKGVYCINYVSE